MQPRFATQRASLLRRIKNSSQTPAASAIQNSAFSFGARDLESISPLGDRLAPLFVVAPALQDRAAIHRRHCTNARLASRRAMV